MPLRPRTTPALLILLALLQSCAPREVKLWDHTILGGRDARIPRPLRFGVVVDESDPAHAAALRSALVRALVHARLFKRDDQGRVVGDLVAETTVAPDGLVYTFTLREEARYQDGRGVTARDVVFAVQDFRNASAPHLKAALASVRAVEIAGPRTVRWSLERPLPDLPAMLLEMPVRPRGPRSRVGAGAWRVVATGSRGVTLAPHAEWHGGKARAELLRLVWLRDEASLASALEEGRVDLGLLGETTLRRGLAATAGNVLDTTADRAAVLVQDPRCEALADPRARRALGRLLPGAEELVRLGAPRRRFPPGIPTSTETPAPAADLLRGAGWKQPAEGSFTPPGSGPGVTVGCPAGDAMLCALARILVKTWNARGVPARLVAAPEQACAHLAWLQPGAGLVWRLARPLQITLAAGGAPDLAAEFRTALSIRSLPGRRRAAARMEARILDAGLVLPVADLRVALVAREGVDLGGLQPGPSPLAIAYQLWRVALPREGGR